MKPKASSDEGRSKNRKRRSRSRKAGSGGASETGSAGKVWKGPLDPWAVNDATLEGMRFYIRNCGLSQAELARRWKVNRQWVSKLLNEVKVCTVDMLYRFCNGVHRDGTDFLSQMENRLPRLPSLTGSTKSAK